MVRTQGVMKAIIVSADRSDEFIAEELAKPLHRDQVERVTTDYPIPMVTGNIRSPFSTAA